jgi:hypothetical protein
MIGGSSEFPSEREKMIDVVLKNGGVVQGEKNE